eukprot:gnl/TRDRNA2_/TRDRNA2_36186_c0_seq1.p1 gnl/TRDRNA2_/TRDRNA2_36186_c0~~gnl/TRDRNA2_/TRDRNA2_36186_c0_seq1.p1  ORF type:complete len:693 (-),score=135.73 gnl/TRDRNA2_/TRDRNA2_36186_c0_seq1:65-2143(-)
MPGGTEAAVSPSDVELTPEQLKDSSSRVKASPQAVASPLASSPATARVSAESSTTWASAVSRTPSVGESPGAVPIQTVDDDPEDLISPLSLPEPDSLIRVTSAHISTREDVDSKVTSPSQKTTPEAVRGDATLSHFSPEVQVATPPAVTEAPVVLPVEVATPPAVSEAPAAPKEKVSTSRNVNAIGPPECIDASAIYKLYRGTTGGINRDDCRVWVEFTAVQLCWAGYDLPARAYNRVSLLDLASCKHVTIQEEGDSRVFQVEIFLLDTSVGANTAQKPVLSIEGRSAALLDFAEALKQLLTSRDNDGRSGLEFIQKRLFQYLWMERVQKMTDSELYEAQALLAFNLEPKEGVAYLRSKLIKRTDAEVGEWLADMATQKRGIDPSLLGNYFSRRDTLEVFQQFVSRLDFFGVDIVVALRRLFDCFKPGGESQVITRILEMFAASYLSQWQSCRDTVQPAVSYQNADSVFSVAVSLIMLNTGIHVMSKKAPGKKGPGTTMTMEEYIKNTRLVVKAEEVPDAALAYWYEAVKEEEIAVEPIPRVAFRKLPVQPDIEGWLIAILGARSQRRYWAVLALQRMYLFSDANEIEPAEAIDLKETSVRAVSNDDSCKGRFSADLRGGNRCVCLKSSGGCPEIPDAEVRAFEVFQRQDNTSGTGKPPIVQKLAKPRRHLALIAETPDLMQKWVGLISGCP